MKAAQWQVGMLLYYIKTPNNAPRRGKRTDLYSGFAGKLHSDE